MNNSTDQELLREYVERQSQEAFSKLRQRHLNFVYSVVNRAVDGDLSLADDVTQEVFRALSDNAAQLMDRPHLPGWLHRTAQFIASHAVRAEGRRRIREHEAYAMNHLQPDDYAAAWKEVAPHLDAALLELPESIRFPLMMRFFDHKPAHEIALAMNAGEDAIQKRIRRGLERLRELLAKRGVTVSVNALGLAIWTYAVQPAPAGLAATLATAFAAKAATSTAVTTATTTNLITSMTTLQKAILYTPLIGMVGMGVFEAHQQSARRAATEALAQERASLVEDRDRLQKEAEDAKRLVASRDAEILRHIAGNRELLRLRGEVAVLRTPTARPAAAPLAPTEMASWMDRSQRLRTRVEQTPAAQVPELQLAIPEDWLDASKGALETETDYRKAMSALRTAVEGKLIKELSAAFKRFQAVMPGKVPATVAELAAYFDPPVDPALLSRWKVTPPDPEDAAMGAIDLIMQTPVDEEYDQQWMLGPNGYGSSRVRQKQVLKAEGKP